MQSTNNISEEIHETTLMGKSLQYLTSGSNSALKLQFVRKCWKEFYSCLMVIAVVFLFLS